MYRGQIKEKYWIAQARKGDTASYVKFYDAMVEKIYRFIFFKVGSIEEAEDITSETFLKLWESLQKGKQEIKSVRAFTYRIARNLIIDYYRRNAKYVSLENQALKDLEAFIAKNEVQKSGRWQKEVEIKIELTVVYKALGQLKEEYREIIVMKYVDGLATKEIGEVLNKNKNAVRAQLLRAMTALKELLPDNYLNENLTTHKTIKTT